MTVTARDIIQSALEELGVYAPGETVTDADASRGLFQLNDMLSIWAQEYLYMYSLTAQTITLANATATYSIGLGGTVNVARPSRVDYGPGLASVTISAVTTPVNIVSAVEWQAIQSVLPGTGTPNTLFYDPQYPLGQLNVAPTPTVAGTLTFNAWYAFQAFAALSTSAIFSAGAVDAMKANLAIKLQPFFVSAQVSPVTATLAAESKFFLKQTNTASRAMLKRMPGGGRMAAGG